MGFMDRILKRKGRVYISFDDHDRDIAEDVRKVLESKGMKCWIRAFDSSFIEIVHTIESSQLFVLVMSRSSVDSNHVNAEADVAFSNEVPFCVFRIEDIEIPDSLKFYLGKSPLIDAYPKYSASFDELVGKSLGILEKRKVRVQYKPDKTASPAKRSSGIKTDVFISYSSRDMKVAERICEALEGEGLKCWIAPRNLDIDKNFAEETLAAIRDSRIFVPVISSDYQESNYAIAELDCAFSENKIIVPFMLDGSLPKGKTEFFLKNATWADGSSDFDEGVDALLGEVSAFDLIKATTSPCSAESISFGGSNAKPQSESTRLLLNMTNVCDNTFDVSGRLMDEAARSLAGKAVRIYVDSTFRYEVETGRDGGYLCPVTFNKSGNRTVEAVFDGDLRYSPSSESMTVGISKMACEMMFSAQYDEVRSGEDIVLYGCLKSGQNPITRAYLDIYGGGELIDTIFTSKSGNFSIMIPDVGENRDFRAVFSENDTYVGCESSPVNVRVLSEGQRPFGASNEMPYLFISYKHLDKERVLPIIEKFHYKGYNIWFDDGLYVGGDYDDLIDLRIEESSLFVIFISENVISRADNQKEYMKNELAVAKATDTPMFPIYLDDVPLKAKYRVHLVDLHSLFLSEYEDEEAFIDECVKDFKEHFGLEPRF